MAQSSTTDVVMYVIIGFIAVCCILIISLMANEVSNSSHAELTTESEEYMYDIATDPSSLGFNITPYSEKIESAIDPDVADNKNEFSLDFTYGKKTANALGRFVYSILNLPEFLIIKLFKFPVASWSWIVDLLDWLYRILMFVAIVYFLRGK